MFHSVYFLSPILSVTTILFFANFYTYLLHFTKAIVVWKIIKYFLGLMSNNNAKAKLSQLEEDDLESGQTFGDEERRCVKEFREAYNSYSKVY